MDAGEALALIVELVEVLDAAETELELLTETEMPLPDAVTKQLEGHDAMKRTLRRLIEESANPTRMRARAVEIYREEAARACRTDSGLAAPVDEDVRRQLATMREILRRRALTDGDLGYALDGALLRSALAGC